MTKERLLQILRELKDTAEVNEKTARKNGGEALGNYYAGVKSGLHYALGWLHYYFNDEQDDEAEKGFDQAVDSLINEQLKK